MNSKQIVTYYLLIIFITALISIIGILLIIDNYSQSTKQKEIIKCSDWDSWFYLPYADGSGWYLFCLNGTYYGTYNSSTGEVVRKNE